MKPKEFLHLLEITILTSFAFFIFRIPKEACTSIYVYAGFKILGIHTCAVTLASTVKYVKYLWELKV